MADRHTGGEVGRAAYSHVANTAQMTRHRERGPCADRAEKEGGAADVKIAARIDGRIGGNGVLHEKSLMNGQMIQVEEAVSKIEITTHHKVTRNRHVLSNKDGRAGADVTVCKNC